MDSILDTVKKALGIDADFTGYDSNIITLINAVLVELHAISVGSISVFSITDSTATWTDFLGAEVVGTILGVAIEDNICTKVKAVFDPLATTPVSENPDSILNTIKKLIGIADTAFDMDLITCINTAFMGLGQLGIGSEDYFSISSSAETWADFLNGSVNLAGIKSYIHLKTRLLFDTPTNSFVVTAINNEITELGWRLASQMEHVNYVAPVVEEEEDEPVW